MPSNKSNSDQRTKIEITENGPYIIKGDVPLKKQVIVPDEEGMPLEWMDGEEYPFAEEYRLCRCGHSDQKPFCDGTHSRINFDGTEVASHDNYDHLAKTFTGPELILTDAREFCASAHFCHRHDGTWYLISRSNNPQLKQMAIEQTQNCPSGRIISWEKETGKNSEPLLEPSISITEDPLQQVSGPLWIKGRIPVESADGDQYEIRNRVTLCRCGKSGNKPFCNGTHVAISFNDGDLSLNNKPAS